MDGDNLLNPLEPALRGEYLVILLLLFHILATGRLYPLRWGGSSSSTPYLPSSNTGSLPQYGVNLNTVKQSCGLTDRAIMAEVERGRKAAVPPCQAER